MARSFDVPLDDLFGVEVSEPTGHPLLDESLIGKTLDGRFRIVERIGSGGMGSVYKAVQLPMNRVVAVKVLERKEMGRPDPAFTKRFKLEAASTSKLRHPNTIQVFDHGCTQDGLLFIAMEYLEGQTLAELLTKHECVPWPRALHIATQICRSLREAHRLGLVHRDLKPANVMLLPEAQGKDHVKVLDFGLVKQFAHPSLTNSEVITAHGMIVGSPQYMAPEQATGAGADQRSDIYALGVVLYEALCGKPPFQARQYVAVLLKHVHDAPPPLASMRPGLEVPEPIQQLVLRCLEKDRDQRFQSMDEVIAGIQQAVTACGEELTLPAVRMELLQDEPPPPSRGKVAALGLVGFLAAAGLGAFGIAVHHELTSPAQAEPAQRMTVTTSANPAPLAAPAAPVVEPQPPAAAPVPVDPPAPAPPRITFHVSSQPTGARVWLRGRSLGLTPLDFDLPPGEDGAASAPLEFRLEGYQSLTVTAGGAGPEITLIQPMRPVPPKVRKVLAAAAKVKRPAPAGASAGVAAIAEVGEPPAGDPTRVATPAQPVVELPAGPPKAAPEPNRTPPALIQAQEPLYSRAAYEAKAEGTVTARCLILETGAASDCKILKGVPLMDQAVIDALEASRFRPATQDGAPVAAEHTVQLRLVPPP